MKRDLHVHTTYSDGKNTPEEVVLKALEKGMVELGFSDHSFTKFDDSYCMSEEGVKEYFSEIARLKEKYADKIKIYAGIEQDYFSDPSPIRPDYVIGSVHYIKSGEDYIEVDNDKQTIVDASYRFGDFYSLAEEYYRLVGNVYEKTKADVIGHFDLISKFNEDGDLFDKHHPRYVNAWKKAADELLKSGAVFEINTGAISRGYRTVPYPDQEIVRYIKEKGGKFILSSDSHSADNLLYAFDKYEEWL